MFNQDIIEHLCPNRQQIFQLGRDVQALVSWKHAPLSQSKRTINHSQCQIFSNNLNSKLINKTQRSTFFAAVNNLIV